MRKLLKLLSGYDNYLDEGAISELLGRLENIKISNTIVYEINLGNDINTLCKNLDFIRCSNSYGEYSSETVCDVYLSLMFTKNVIYKNGMFKSSASESSIEIMRTVMEESDYTAVCEFNFDNLIIFEKMLINYIKKRMDIISKKNVNIIGLHNMYDKNIMFNLLEDVILMGYDNSRFLLVEFIPEIRAVSWSSGITLR